MTQDESLAVEEQAQEIFRYLGIMLAASVVGAITLLVHPAIVISGYDVSSGTYTDYPLIGVFPGAATAIAARWVGGYKADRLVVGIISALVALVAILLSDYIIGHFLISQAISADGYPPLDYLLPPDLMFQVFVTLYSTDPALLLGPIFGTAAGFFLAYVGERNAPIPTVSPSEVPAQVARMEARTSQPPPDVAAFGPPSKRFGPSRMRPAYVTIAILLLPLILMIWVFSPSGPLQIFLVVAILMAPVVGFLIVMALHSNDEVLIYSKGLSINLRGKTQVLAWDDITQVWHSHVRQSINYVPIYTHHLYVLEDRNGQKMKIDHLYINNLDELGEVINEETTRRLLPSMVEAIKNGQAIEFGLFQVDKGGITHGKSRASWEEIKSMQVNNGYLYVGASGAWGAGQMSAAVGNIPNITAFLTILQKLKNSPPL
jgi:hypothetical protein